MAYGRDSPLVTPDSRLSTPDAPRKAFFLGIGGIGMSALAQWMQDEGWEVQGADRTRTDITALLEQRGVLVRSPEPTTLPTDCSLLVYSDAVPAAHPLRRDAARRNIRQETYAQRLGEQQDRFQSVVVVSGTHGKSSTTALVGLILEAAGADPTVVVGTSVPQWAGRGQGTKRPTLGNYRAGHGSVLIVEGDEYRDHVKFLEPTVAVVTSLDYDHVDYFPTEAEYLHPFRAFIGRVKKGGLIVLPAEGDVRAKLDPGTKKKSEVQVHEFVVSSDPRAASVVASPPVVRGSAQEFSLTVEGTSWGTFQLSAPGAHMVQNAAAAVAATLPFSVKPVIVRRALAEFRGTWRRFERVGTLNGAPVVSDYAHHPTELRALAAAARQWHPDRRLVIAFQPHQRARTKAFGPQFVEALTLFDAIILTEVYDVAGREDPNDRTTSRDWVKPLRAAGKPVTFTTSLADTEAVVRAEARDRNVILIVGAGDIDAIARRLAHPSAESLADR